MSADRKKHEAKAARVCRQRRLKNGEPPATYVLDAWRQRLRLARTAKLAPADRERILG